jgi:hypothetical protein
MLERTLRTSPVTGIRVDPVFNAILLAEVISPSEQLWLVSPWITDVVTLDNSRGDYDGLFEDSTARGYTLAEVLGEIVKGGAKLTVVTRPAGHNTPFLERLGRLAEPSRLDVIQHQDMHEKTFCGQDWILGGSMNYTVRGLGVNDEATTYKVGLAAAAQARIDLAHRWKVGS